MKKISLTLLATVIFLLGFSYLYSFLSDYEVYVSRKSNNLYKIESSDLWIETSFCSNFGFSEKVILSTGGFGKGQLVFRNGTRCDIKEIYKAERVYTGTKAVTTYGEIVEIQSLLTPTRIR